MNSEKEVRHTFKKAERLTRKKLIQELFEHGSSFFLYPLKVLYLTKDDPTIGTYQVLFTVSKRNFKNATDRNLLKRRMREAFRKCKEKIYYSFPKQPNLLIAYIYVGKDVATYKEIEKSTVSALQKVIQKLQDKKDNEQKSKD